MGKKKTTTVVDARRCSEERRGVDDDVDVAHEEEPRIRVKFNAQALT